MNEIVDSYFAALAPRTEITVGLKGLLRWTEKRKRQLKYYR